MNYPLLFYGAGTVNIYGGGAVKCFPSAERSPESNNLDPVSTPDLCARGTACPCVEPPTLARPVFPPPLPLAPLHLACMRQASCHVLLVKSCSQHFCISYGKEHANGEGGG